MGIKHLWESWLREVVHFSSCQACSTSSSQVGCSHKHRMCHGDPNWATDPNRSPNIKLQSKMWHELLFAVLSSLPSVPAQRWPLIRWSICNNRCIFNTFVLIPSTPYSKAIFLPRKKRRKHCSQFLSAEITHCCTELSGSASHLLPDRKKNNGKKPFIWGGGHYYPVRI